MHPLLILGVSIAVVLFLIIKLKVNAFLALIAAAIVVGLLAAVPSAAYPAKTTLGKVMDLVTGEFGVACGKIGIVIALAAVIGVCMMESGAADKITRRFVALLG